MTATIAAAIAAVYLTLVFISFLCFVPLMFTGGGPRLKDWVGAIYHSITLTPIYWIIRKFIG